MGIDTLGEQDKGLKVTDLTVSPFEHERKVPAFDLNAEVTDMVWKQLEDLCEEHVNDPKMRVVYARVLAPLKLLFPDRNFDLRRDRDVVWKNLYNRIVEYKRTGDPDAEDIVWETLTIFPEKRGILTDDDFERMQEIFYQEPTDSIYLVAKHTTGMLIAFPGKRSEILSDPLFSSKMLSELNSWGKKVENEETWIYSWMSMAREFFLLFPEQREKVLFPYNFSENSKKLLDLFRTERHIPRKSLLRREGLGPNESYSTAVLTMAVICAHDARITQDGELKITMESPELERSNPDLPNVRRF